jgi:hypothetical protein
VREAVENEEIVIKFCPTGEMVADALTKPLPTIKHQFFMEGMRLPENQKHRYVFAELVTPSRAGFAQIFPHVVFICG